MSNNQVNRILRRAKIKHFRGVYSCNNIPKILPKNIQKSFSLIINLSKINTIGTHFISLIYNNKTLLYLDPLALNFTIHNYINEFILTLPSKTKLIFINKPIQDVNSDYCGLFCIFFVLYFSEKYDFNNKNKIIPFRQKKLAVNDKICEKNVKTLLLHV